MSIYISLDKSGKYFGTWLDFLLYILPLDWGIDIFGSLKSLEPFYYPIFEDWLSSSAFEWFIDENGYECLVKGI